MLGYRHELAVAKSWGLNIFQTLRMPGLQTRRGINEEEAEAQLAEDLAREVMADYLCGDARAYGLS